MAFDTVHCSNSCAKRMGFSEKLPGQIAENGSAVSRKPSDACSGRSGEGVYTLMWKNGTNSFGKTDRAPADAYQRGTAPDSDTVMQAGSFF